MLSNAATHLSPKLIEIIFKLSNAANTFIPKVDRDNI